MDGYHAMHTIRTETKGMDGGTLEVIILVMNVQD